jgi:hypothetical protein
LARKRAGRDAGGTGDAATSAICLGMDFIDKIVFLDNYYCPI